MSSRGFSLSVRRLKVLWVLPFLGAGWSRPRVRFLRWMLTVYFHCGRGLYVQLGWDHREVLHRRAMKQFAKDVAAGRVGKDLIAYLEKLATCRSSHDWETLGLMADRSSMDLPDTDWNSRKAARVGDTYACPIHGSNPIVTGSPNVIINGRKVARVGDKTACGATIVDGSSTILAN